MSNPLHLPPDGDRTPARWSADGLMARLAAAIALPALVGGLVASFMPWPDWRWTGFAIAAVLTAGGVWLWLDTTVARRLTGVARMLDPGGDAKAVKPGGGLSALVETAQAARAREREHERGAERLEIVRAALADLTARSAEWAETEHAPAFDAGAAPEEVAPLVLRLALAAQRLEERAEAQRAVAIQVRESVSDAGGRASQLAAAAERQFVEAGSLLGVLRGIERAATDLVQGMGGIAAQLAARSAEAEAMRANALAWSQGATARIEELRKASAQLEAARQALASVHDAAQLAAIESAHAALADGDLAGGDRARLTDALAALVRATRAAHERAEQLEILPPDELERAVEELERLRSIQAGETPANVGDPGGSRALSRLLENLEDAIARAAKLVQQAERTSSEAQRAGEGIAMAVDEVDGLTARFAGPPPEPPRLELEPPAAAAPLEEMRDEPSRPLRVLGPEDMLPDDETWSHG